MREITFLIQCKIIVKCLQVLTGAIIKKAIQSRLREEQAGLHGGRGGECIIASAEGTSLVGGLGSS